MKKKVLSFITDGKKFLALRNNPSEPEKHGGDFWFTVTGGVENEEGFEDAVRREILEETSLKVKNVFNLNWGCIYKNHNEENEEHYYLAFVSPGKIILDVEHVDYEWLSFPKFLNRIKWDGNKKELKRTLQSALDSNDDFFLRGIIDDFINHNRIIYVKGKKYIIKWHSADDFSKIPKEKVTQVYGVCFDKSGKMIVVDVRRRDNWALPGGGIEKGENYFETLRRECMEEADMEITDIKPIGYNETIEIDENGHEKEIYQLRYFARITRLRKQTIDVATGVIPFRKLIKPEDFGFYCPWGFQGNEIISKAVKMFNS
ncbi:NUDIX domain-containing protein [Candidatus Pacearchaeota archaeon]|nr:NUDIX domain-containing protein [Candidatus Pacearchaeota archaeon]